MEVHECFSTRKAGSGKGIKPVTRSKVRTYFKDEQHRREFEDWYEQRYGKKYKWKKVTA